MPSCPHGRGPCEQRACLPALSAGHGRPLWDTLVLSRRLPNSGHTCQQAQGPQSKATCLVCFHPVKSEHQRGRKGGF